MPFWPREVQTVFCTSSWCFSLKFKLQVAWSLNFKLKHQLQFRSSSWSIDLKFVVKVEVQLGWKHFTTDNVFNIDIVWFDILTDLIYWVTWYPESYRHNEEIKGKRSDSRPDRKPSPESKISNLNSTQSPWRRPPWPCGECSKDF